MKPQHQAVALMVACTVFLTLGQYFAKVAGTTLTFTLTGILLNFALFAALIFSGIGAVLMTLAFKKGELSTLFPIVSLSFIWTIIVAAIAFHEPITLGKFLGTLFIIAGVGILGGGK